MRVRVLLMAVLAGFAAGCANFERIERASADTTNAAKSTAEAAAKSAESIEELGTAIADAASINAAEIHTFLAEAEQMAATIQAGIDAESEPAADIPSPVVVVGDPDERAQAAVAAAEAAAAAAREAEANRRDVRRRELAKVGNWLDRWTARMAALPANEAWRRVGEAHKAASAATVVAHSAATETVEKAQTAEMIVAQERQKHEMAAAIVNTVLKPIGVSLPVGPPPPSIRQTVPPPVRPQPSPPTSPIDSGGDVDWGEAIALFLLLAGGTPLALKGARKAGNFAVDKVNERRARRAT